MINLRRKLRIGISDEHGHKELWHIFLSPFRIIGVSVGAVAVLFIAILTLAAFTPLLNLVPGYPGSKQREAVIHNILRVDSIEQRMADLESWGYDLSLIMEGRTPVVHDMVSSNDSARVERPARVSPNHADSTLRSQIEGSGRYGLSHGQPGNSGMQAPVRGTVTEQFAPGQERFGVSVATGPTQQVMAVADGTVVWAGMGVGTGWALQIQHANNVLSTYRHLSESLVKAGVRVKKGEVLGTVTAGGELFEFELWQSGNPANPENYMVF